MVGFAGLVAGAAVYDILAVRHGWETVSTGFRRCYRHNHGRLLVGAAVGALAMHLFETAASA